MPSTAAAKTQRRSVAVPTANWQVILHPNAAAQDITRTLSQRLVSLSVTCTTGDTADQLDLILSNADGRLAIPPTGATLAVLVGWKDTGLTLLGHFSVDELELSSPPARLHITGRAADVSSSWHEKKERSFDNITLGTLAAVIAQAHELPLKIDASLAGKTLDHVDQTNESDLNLLTRIAGQYGGTATVKAAMLLVLPANSDKSVSGKELPGVSLNTNQVSRWRWSTHDRSKYTGVCARWHDTDTANTLKITSGVAGCVLTLETLYASKEEAVNAAAAKFTELRRARGKMSLSLSQGSVNRQPGARCTLSGFHPLIDAASWQVDRVVHKIDQAGFSQTVEMSSGDDGG